jgi:hypothetical protein
MEGLDWALVEGTAIREGRGVELICIEGLGNGIRKELDNSRLALGVCHGCDAVVKLQSGELEPRRFTFLVPAPPQLSSSAPRHSPNPRWSSSSRPIGFSLPTRQSRLRDARSLSFLRRWNLTGRSRTTRSSGCRNTSRPTPSTTRHEIQVAALQY